MDNIDISQLTKEAESGKGCSIEAKLQEMSFDDSLKTVRAIAHQNKINRTAETFLPEVSAYITDGDSGFRATLYIRESSSFPEVIVNDTQKTPSRSETIRSQSCTDKH
jgi:hypothetical protein